MINLIVGATIGYLVGSIPFSWLYVKLGKGIDLRDFGSKNVGGRNAGRAGGKIYGFARGISDALKGLLALCLGWLYARIWAVSSMDLDGFYAVIAVGAVLGHCYPWALKFRGGRGVATSLAIFLAFNPFLILEWLVLLFLLLLLIPYMFIAYNLAFLGLVPLSMYSPLWPWWGIRNKFLPMIALSFSLIILSRQGGNYASLKRGKIKKINLWKAMKGQLEEFMK